MSSGYALSADGKWLAVWARDPETPGEKKQKDAKADADWVNHEKHGSRLYLAALKADGAMDGAIESGGDCARMCAERCGRRRRTGCWCLRKRRTIWIGSGSGGRGVDCGCG